MSEPQPQKPVELQIPAGEAREDERELEKIADRVEEGERLPGRIQMPALAPMKVVGPDGAPAGMIDAAGKAVGIPGRVVHELTPEMAHHEQMRRLKPCVSCGQSYFPKEGSRAAAEIAAFVADGLQWGYMRPGETVAGYMHCRAWDKCVHVSQHCLPEWGPSRHVYRKGWLAGIKAFIARHRGGR